MSQVLSTNNKSKEKKKKVNDVIGGFTLKTPKGTKDYDHKDMSIRNKMFSTIISVFENCGAVNIDTPEILSGKYGEDSKLIYDLENQGGESCSLRYDLTVPFARYLAMNSIDNMKRYHIGKVYRRDQPSIAQGRLREFYQCDFDICGVYDNMMPDAEVIYLLSKILEKLELGVEIQIKINHRKILDGIFEVAGVPEDKFRPISSAVDKLDKIEWSEVKKEMVEEKGLDEKVADKIGEIIKLNGDRELYYKLKDIAEYKDNKRFVEGLEDMNVLFEYLEAYDVLNKISFDLSLARGLDYYTGLIYEAVIINNQNENLKVGSIAAGGRYDNLVGMFSGNNKKNKKVQIPCVGVSIGVERIFTILMAKVKDKKEIKSSNTMVYIISIRDNLVKEKIKICTELRENNIACEYAFKAKPKLQNQFSYCDKFKIPLAVIIGSEELKNNTVKIKNMSHKIEEEGSGIEIKREDIVKEIKKRLNL